MHITISAFNGNMFFSFLFFQRVSRYEGDLVGKCYYAKRKLVWEVLETGLKSKIEIQWSDISAMKASCPDNLPGSLEIEVYRSLISNLPLLMKVAVARNICGEVI